MELVLIHLISQMLQIISSYRMEIPIQPRRLVYFRRLGAGSGGELVTGANTVSIDLVSDIDGTLTVSNSVLMTVTDFLILMVRYLLVLELMTLMVNLMQVVVTLLFYSYRKFKFISNTVTDLGTFAKSTGTVTYDEADAQDVDNVEYHNLTLSGSGNKTVQGSH